MSIIKSPTLIRGVAPPHPIEQSIRFNSPDNPAMSKTFSGAGTNKTWTFSCWFKRGGKEETRNMIFSAGSAGNSFGGLELGHGYGASYGRAPLRFYNYTGSGYDWSLQTSMAFADFSAWYHVTVVCDTTNAVASERARIYVNGVRITDFNSSGITANSFPSLDFAGNHWMGTTEHDIGTSIFTTQNFDGYLAEIHNIDGQALDCNSFAEFNSSGIWVPKEYTGSYGTNGFHIKGESASDLGNDSSGNNNDFTTSGLASHDQVSDSPTNNFNTINPLNPLSDGTLSQGNLKNVLSGNDQFYTTQELGIKSYCEVRVDALSNYGGTLGLGTFGGDDDDNSLVFQTNYSSGYIYLNGGNASANIGGTVSAGDIVMMAYDPTTRKWWVGVNGTWRNSGDPANGTGQVYQHSTTDFGDGIGAIVWGGWKGSANGLTVTWNFGQEGTFGGQETAGGNSDGNGIGNFKYSVPSGFLALCTKNLGS